MGSVKKGLLIGSILVIVYAFLWFTEPVEKTVTNAIIYSLLTVLTCYLVTSYIRRMEKDGEPG
ncbi:MAG: hypothetical protein DRN49_01470 [Thaumarchaeota archaeon]|nr:MAG: hypothetical protein DRN49_01470 [Nitrososphaerota archaeon]